MTIGQLIFTIIIVIIVLNRIWYQIHNQELPIDRALYNIYALITTITTILLILILCSLVVVAIMYYWGTPL